jgi:single-strand DNA-binding protein
MNISIFDGRFTRDPEMRYTKDGKAVLKYSIAVNHYKDVVSFINCVAFDKVAENIAKYCKKGMRVIIEGEIHQNNWMDKDQHKHTTFEILCRHVTFFDGKKSEEGSINDNTTDGKGKDQTSDIPF